MYKYMCACVLQLSEMLMWDSMVCISNVFKKRRQSFLFFSLLEHTIQKGWETKKKTVIRSPPLIGYMSSNTPMRMRTNAHINTRRHVYSHTYASLHLHWSAILFPSILSAHYPLFKKT